MKRNNDFILKIAAFLMAIPMLIVACSAIGLFSWLALTLTTATNETAPSSQAVRIRTISELAPFSPAPVTNEPVVEVEAVRPAEAPAEPVVSAPALFETNDSIDSSNDPLPVEDAAETAMSIEAAPAPNEPVVPVEPAAPQAAVPDTVIADEMAATSPDAETINPAEELSEVEVPAEPIVVEPAPPEIAANPGQAQNPPPVPPEAPKSNFVPDSSFFDQLLDQVD